MYCPSHSVENKKVTVEYAADLPSSQYGSGFPLVRNPNRLDSDFVYEENCFNLNNTYRADGSLLRVIEEKGENISGITQPWMYVGMMFATFCWHVEDLFLNSVN
jgi:histone demethylase JARID1